MPADICSRNLTASSEPKGLLQLHLGGGIGEIGELALDLLQNGNHALEAAAGVDERQAKLVTGLGRLHDERLVQRARLGARHGGLKLTEHGELLV